MGAFHNNRDYTSDVFCVISKCRDKFIYASKAFEDLWGTPPKNLRSAQSFFLEPILPEDRHKVCDMLCGVVDHENRKYRIASPDQTIRWISQRTINVSSNVDDVYQIRLLDDITEHLADTFRPAHHQQIAQVVGKIAKDLIQASSNNINVSINHTLKEMGMLVQADLSYLFRIDNIASSMSNTHRWYRDSIPAQIESLQNLPLNMVPWVIHHLQAGSIINVPDIQHLTDDAVSERKLFQKQNILSVLLVPIMANETLMGFIGFGAVKGRMWMADEIVILQFVAELIGGVVQRLQHEANLMEYDIRLSMALAAASSGLFDFDVTSNHAYLSPEFYATLGFTHIHESRQVPLEMLWRWIHPGDLPRVQAAAKRTVNCMVRFHQCFRIRNGQDQYCLYRLQAENLTHPLTGKRRIVGVLDDMTTNNLPLLTKRESEVLRMLTTELTLKEIAHELAVSRHTVDNHVRKIYAKLGTQTRLETVLRARSKGFLYLT